jgi:hypothetical protein
MNRAPILGSGANEPNEAIQEDGFHNLVKKVLILSSNAQIPSNKQPLNSNIIIKAIREVARKYKTTQGKLLLEFAVLSKLEEQVEKSVLILKLQLEKTNLNPKSLMKF